VRREYPGEDGAPAAGRDAGRAAVLFMGPSVGCDLLRALSERNVPQNRLRRRGFQFGNALFEDLLQLSQRRGVRVGTGGILELLEGYSEPDKRLVWGVGVSLTGHKPVFGCDALRV
jgi:hypothetical protein